ncbi:MAG: hypothetical protein JWP88_1098 [Flaviaesturariibacter sp.]|nr:hypothetical protein [Flaviaesturariibacter sp.]
MRLLKSLRSEILKTKRTGPLYFTIAAAAFGPLMSMLDILLDGVEADNRKDIFNDMLIKKFQMTGLVALPIFLILVCTLLSQIEYKNNAWKQVLISPQSKGNVFLAKFINVQLLIGVFFITNFLLMFLCAVVLHFMDPSLDVLNQPLNGYKVLMTRLNTYLAVLAICVIQFWLGLKFKSFITPVAIGIGSWFIGTLLVMQDIGFAAYFPHSFHAYGRFPKYDPLANPVGLTSVAFAVLFLVIAFLDFRKRRMNG